jgi:hypothetical protein
MVVILCFRTPPTEDRACPCVCGLSSASERRTPTVNLGRFRGAQGAILAFSWGHVRSTLGLVELILLNRGWKSSLIPRRPASATDERSGSVSPKSASVLWIGASGRVLRNGKAGLRTGRPDIHQNYRQAGAAHF